MDYNFSFGDNSDHSDNILDDSLFMMPLDKMSTKRNVDDMTSSVIDNTKQTPPLSFPEKVLGQQIKEKTQTNVVSKKTSVYLSAVMEGIAKYVLCMAGEGKDAYVMPENKCIRVEDVEKVISSVGVPDSTSDIISRHFMHGKTICIDSINTSLLERALQTINNYFKDYIEVQTLSITPSPLLQDYMFHQADFDDSVVLTTYCERLSTALQFQPKCSSLLIIPRSLRLLLAISMAHGKQKQQSLLYLRDYLNTFYDSTELTLDIYLDSNDNTKFYSDYNTFRRDKAAGKDNLIYQPFQSHIFKLETEQIVFYKVIRDLLKGKWVIPIPRYCHPESWEYEQMMKIATGKVNTMQRCKVTLEFHTNTLSTENTIIYSDGCAIMKKFKLLKKGIYHSPWNNEPCEEKNRTVLCNLGLLCLCPIEVIPVIYHHIYYQCHIIFFSSHSENNPSIRNILSLIRGPIV